MKDYKKTFIGSIVAFFIGTSCCWLSSLAIWIGGATILGTVSSFVDRVQIPLVGLGVVLLLVAVYSFVKRRKV